MGNQSSSTLVFPTAEYRSLPLPNHSVKSGPTARVSTFFVRVADIPEEITDWMKVNPRVPKYDKKNRLKGPVVAGMRNTLDNQPQLFELKNQGIWLLVEHADFKKSEGGKGAVTLTLSDETKHGLVNGGHTVATILQWREELDEEGEDPPTDAYVRVHVLEGVAGEHVIDLAEGLNRSMQVDDPSLANLAGRFESIKKVLEGKPGAEEIAYRQGDPGDVDIMLVLTMMSMFDLERYPDRKTHPNLLFGQQKAVLQHFIDDSKGADSSFERILPMLPEILRLSDQIQQAAFERCGTRISKLKLSNAKTGNRAGSKKHKGLPAHFAGGVIGGKFHLGWLYPALAAFRANVSAEAWAGGKFKWLVKPTDLIDDVIDEIVDVIIREHQDNNMKPGEVGRRDAAYRLCYSAVAMELAQRGKLQAA